MEIKTRFKSSLPEKKDSEISTSSKEAFFTQPDLYHYLDAFPDLTAVVNKERQVIYANKALIAFLQLTPEIDSCATRPGGLHAEQQAKLATGPEGLQLSQDAWHVSGPADCSADTKQADGLRPQGQQAGCLRPGDLFNCLHSQETADGCGTAAACQFCGAAQVINTAHETKQAVQKECILRTVVNGQERAYNFSVTATPFVIADTEYILLTFRDINSEKQKLALERIFFHDILNTISSLQVNIELLKRSPAESSQALITKIETISQILVDEINSQKMLISAENKTLKVQNNLILSTQLAQEVIDHFKDHDIAEKRKVEIKPFSEAFAFVSDATIIRRVLINMLKNALEASPPAATVTMGFKKENNTLTYWVHNPTYIEKDIQLQVFNRYFSTKGLNRGLGTYSMKLLTENYLQGKLFFKTDPVTGTTFYLNLPFKDFKELSF